MIGHNSCTDQARESAKTSMDAGDSMDSNEIDKNIPSHLKVLRKMRICAFALLIFLAIFRENRKTRFSHPV